MDTIKFVIEQYVVEEHSFSFPAINIYINDRNLIDLVSEIENRYRGLGNETSDCSEYIGFQAVHFERFHDEMMGKKVFRKSVLLTCTCTFEMCNCLMTKIDFDGQIVTWSEIRSPWLGGETPSPWIDPAEAQELGWKPYDYSDLGPFVFDREQYLAALDQVTQEWETQKSLFFPLASPPNGTNEFGLLGLAGFE